MATLAGLLKIGSMAESLGVYVPAMVGQKALGLLRVLLFVNILREAQAEYGLWGLAMMVFSLAAPVATLGANHGLVRYASLYETRGQLLAFYRRVRWGCLVCAAAVTAVMFLGSGRITAWVFTSARSGGEIAYSRQLHACWAALANVLAGALYFNMLALAAGMRAYRIASVIELLFSIAFTAVGAAILSAWPTATALLAGHLFCLVLSLGVGMALLERAIPAIDAQAHVPAQPVQGEVAGRIPQQDAPVDGALRKVLGFGLVSMIGNMLWLAAQYVSFYLTNRRYSKADAGVFTVFMQLSQMVLLVGNAAWAVIFTHVARRWESGQRREAMFTLETAFKVLSLALMSMTLAVYAAGPVWVRLLPERYRMGLSLLGGQLMFCQAVAHFSLVTVIARLRERPGLIALAAAAGAAANAALAAWWMPLYSYGPTGAAWAAGAGIYIGAGIVTAAYLLLARIRLHPSTCLILAAPVLLVLPAWAGLAAWAVVIAAAVATDWFLTDDQKRLVRVSAGGIVGKFREAMPWR